MSFLSRTTPIARTLARSSITQQSPRCFSVAAVHQKSATEAVKDGLKKVDRAVSDVAVAGIDKGVEAKDKVAGAVGAESGKAEGTAQQLAGEAKGKAAELKGQAKGKAEEIKGKM
ncbi:hypothetical protein B0A52_07725 [Exophiala mesophila]|uniref:CsbD-like domain-containing protein n=1 Tax=Exophiala mesophila TaxID=212818 RepID=A0A438MVM8_EXOME|nr:hypothetical protein B0A52_07725 [Exophiala mesophila]